MATKIYIDQGHNPQNPNAGAEGNGYREQDLTYAIGVELGQILGELGFEVRLSRNSPTEVLGTSNQSSLTARVRDANAWGADYFISLHTNAAANPAATGSEALVYRTGSVAAALAADILRGLNRSTGLRNRGVMARPGLYVLRRTQMPAVLVEMGFISNRGDASWMANSPELFAQGIADGIVDYVGLPASATPTFNPAPAPEVETPQLTLPLENESSVTDSDGAEPFYADYGAFIAENSSSGLLKIQAFRGDQVYPVEGVEVKLAKDFADGEYIFFEDATDADGIIDGIELPAPPVENSLSPGLPDRYATYSLYVYHPSYGESEHTVDIFEGIKTVQPLRLNVN